MTPIGAGKPQPKVDATSVDFQRRSDGRITSTIRFTGWTAEATREAFVALGFDANILRGLDMVSGHTEPKDAT